MAEAKIKLNVAQRQAVESIDGPMLVLAGPGTGKTQLLSARVAEILKKTDTLASNILCLTFTEAGAANMLERLTGFIGQAAYEVNISTYHAFGGNLISHYPEFFTETRLENPVDELGQHEIIKNIIDGLSYHNPLKTTKVKDIIGAISDLKRGLLSADELRAIAGDNSEFISAINPKIAEIFGTGFRMPRKLEQALPYFEQTLAAAKPLAPANPANQALNSLASTLVTTLDEATLNAKIENKTNQLTDWKNNWLDKNKRDEFKIKFDFASYKLLALADVMSKYETSLAGRGLYDYDDMIIRAVHAMETKDDFRFSLQEKYQYILLDEYQDTNAAQAKLVELLTNNPVSEGRPNVMAVGDDDQAIYAFQGAEASNLAEFASRYKDTKIIPLTENYRSQPAILEAAKNVAEQIEDRTSTKFDGIGKTLSAASDSKQPTIIRREFLSAIAERDWIARQIEKLITKDGASPSDIAVLAPKHKLLEPLVPFLNNLNIPVRYEKRENILETPIIRQLITMSRLVDALAKHNDGLADSYWPEVLSYDFWNIETEAIWQLSWSVNKKKGDNWTKQILKTPKLRWIGLFFMQIAADSTTESLEAILDYLIGSTQLKINDEKLQTATSPMRKYYTSKEFEQASPDSFYQAISHLTVLRQTIRDREAGSDDALKLKDLLSLVELYESSDTRMINTSPYNQASESVQLETVFKAKGLEYQHVFLVGCEDENWGGSSRGGSSGITMTPNLASIRRAGATDDERLRILFVAITRAKIGLYMTSAKLTYSGKASKRLKYFDEREDQQTGQAITHILPDDYQKVIVSSEDVPDIKALEINWRARHLSELKSTKLADLLAERIKTYQLSPTHLNTFTDMERGGPREFLLNTLLRFPQAPSAAGSYGNAIHETLQQVQLELNKNQPMREAAVLDYFEKHLLAKKLGQDETKRRLEQGKVELTKYLAEGRFKPGDRAETKFKNEAVFVGSAHLNGTIDKMELDETDKTMVVVDYKTGKPSGKWGSEMKFHKYKQQLYIYKMLVEGSSTWKNWQVAGERLDFLKPDEANESNTLPLNFKQDEYDEVKALIKAMWQHVMNLDFPDVSKYSKDLKGTRAFEADLIAGKI